MEPEEYIYMRDPIFIQDPYKPTWRLVKYGFWNQTTRKEEDVEPRKQTPSAGRMVHFVYKGTHVPAVIIDPEHFDEDSKSVCQWLKVMTKVGDFPVVADMDERCSEGTWHWPEFVP